MKKLAPIHPGEILLEEFLKPMGISQYALAKALGVDARRINEIIQGKRAITIDTDLRLCRFFGFESGYWIRGQNRYDTKIAERAMAVALDKIPNCKEIANSHVSKAKRSTQATTAMHSC